MDRPNPGADIEIGNQRRIPAIRKTQTEAEDHEMQHNKASSVGACTKEEANQSEWSIRNEAFRDLGLTLSF